MLLPLATPLIWAQNARDAGSMKLSQIEELTAIQLRIARSYAEISALQLRGIAAIRDWNGLQTYLLNQRMVSARFGERLATDARAMLQLSAEMSGIETH